MGLPADPVPPEFVKHRDATRVAVPPPKVVSNVHPFFHEVAMSETSHDVCKIAGHLASELNIRWFEQEIYEYMPETGVHERRSLAWLQSRVLGCLIRDYDDLEINNALVNGICALLKGFSFTAEGMTPPFWIDTRTTASVLLLANGILRLDRGCIDGGWTLDRFDRSLFEVATLPYPYAPDATCPRWLDFLNWMVGGDRDIVNMIRQFTATAFITPRLKLERFLWLVGGGRNGKSTAFSVLRHVLGDKATSALGLNAFSGAHNFRLAPILHRRANFCADASIDRRADMASLNAFVSGDPVALNRKYREHVVMEPTTVLFFASNADPLVCDPSDAFWRRLLLVRCDQKLHDHQVDPTLVDDLKAEASGILNWLLAAIPGILDAKAIDVPEKVRRDVAELQAQVNGFRIFAAEELEAAGTEDCVTRDEMMREFESWAVRNHVRKDDLVAVRQEMKRIFGSKLHRRRKGPGGKRVPVWSGVRWQRDALVASEAEDKTFQVHTKRPPVEIESWIVRHNSAPAASANAEVGACHTTTVKAIGGAIGRVASEGMPVPNRQADEGTPSSVYLDDEGDDISELIRRVDQEIDAETEAAGGAN